MADESKGTLGGRIVALREAKGWGRYDLAKRADLREPSLFRYERDQQIPGSLKLDAIAQALGTTSSYLIHGTGPATPLRLERDVPIDPPALQEFLADNPELEAWEREALRQTALYLGPPRSKHAYAALLTSVRSFGPPTGQADESDAGDDL